MDELYSSVVLIADDSQTSRLALQLQLKRMGYSNVTLVETAEDALEISSRRQGLIDLMFMDEDFGKNMMSGLEATKKILNMYPNIPVIMYTSNGGNDFMEEARKVGVEAFLNKPADVTTLGTYMEIFLDKESLEEKTYAK